MSALVDDIQALQAENDRLRRALAEARTVERARDDLFRRPGGTAYKGARCPCCSRRVKIDSRRLASGMAHALILLHRHARADAAGPEGGWIDITRELMRLGVLAANSNAALLRHWGLIERRRGKDGKSVGHYRVTARGADFAEGRISVPAYAYVFDNRLLALSDGKNGQPAHWTTIGEALWPKFDYAALMKGPA